MRCLTRIISVSVVLACTYSMADMAHAQPDETIQAIEKAWGEREQKVPSIELRWEQIVTAYKGGVSDANRIKGKGGAPLPAADSKYTEKLVLWLANEKIRNEREGQIFDLATESYLPIKMTRVFDGVTSLSIRDQQQLPTPINTGARQHQDAQPDLRAGDLMPVLQALRPRTLALRFVDLDKYRSTGRRVTIRGRPCLELAWATPAPKGSNLLWVDAERGYNIVRRQIVYGIRSSAHSSIQEDIDYQEISPGLWLPDRWTITNGGWSVPLANRHDGQVVSLSLKRPSEIDPSVFITDPPPRTVLTELEGENRRTSITRDDGTSQDLGNARFSSAVAELTGPGPKPSLARRHPALTFGLVTGALIVGIAFLARRWHRNARKVIVG